MNKTRYNKVFCKILQVKENELESLAIKETPLWDSVGHMTLIAALEDEFDIFLEPDDMMALTTYKKGFEIYSVSLDRDKNNWKKAISDDNLIWENHVSDLGYWNSAGAKLYGVSSIPCTFLIDRDGKILAKNLRGDQLHEALKKIFGY